MEDGPHDWGIRGPGRIIAVGNRDPQSEEAYVGAERSTFRGRALVVVETRGEPGEIALDAVGDGVQAGRATIQVG